MLGEPALVAGDHRRDAQREALLAEQRVAAVARAVRPDLAASRGSARSTSRRGCTATATSASPGSSGAPSECTHGTKSPSSPSTSSAAWPARVMIRMRQRDVGRVGDLDADVRERRAERAHAERDDVHRAAAHASPGRARASLVRISAGSIQLLVGPGVVLALGADEGAVLDPGDVARVGRGPVATRAAARGRARRTCRRRRAACRAARTRRRSRRTSGWRRARTARPSPRPSPAGFGSSSGR